MATEVILPRVDMDMTTASISRWFAKDGDTVEKGAVLFEIETDKAAMEIDAPATGRLHRLAEDDGAQVPVGSTVAWILAEGEAAPEAAKAGSSLQGVEASEVSADKAGGVPPSVLPDISPTRGEIMRVSAAHDPEAAGELRSTSSDSGGRPISPLVGEMAGRPEGGASSEPPAPNTKPRATPLARRLARERGLDLSAIPGSGPHGRIQASDVSADAVGHIPPSALPDISPTRGEIGSSPTPSSTDRTQASASSSSRPPSHLISPLVGEMPGRAEGGSSSDLVRSTHSRSPLHRAWLRQGDGTPLVLVHGFGGELDGWRPLVAAARLDCPVLALDLPGHGRSPAGPTAFADILALVAETLVEEGIGEAHLVGHSLGAAIATALADGVVTARSLFLLSPAGLGPEIDAAFLAGFTRATSEASLAPWMRMLVADPATLAPGFVAATARRRAEPGFREAQERLAASLFPDATQVFSVRDSLARIAAPVRIVFGMADRIIPARHATGLPGMVAVHLFPNIGHMPQIEARDDVARLLALQIG